MCSAYQADTKSVENQLGSGIDAQFAEHGAFHVFDRMGRNVHLLSYRLGGQSIGTKRNEFYLTACKTFHGFVVVLEVLLNAHMGLAGVVAPLHHRIQDEGDLIRVDALAHETVHPCLHQLLDGGTACLSREDDNLDVGTKPFGCFDDIHTRAVREHVVQKDDVGLAAILLKTAEGLSHRASLGHNLMLESGTIKGGADAQATYRLVFDDYYFNFIIHVLTLTQTIDPDQFPQ